MFQLLTRQTRDSCSFQFLISVEIDRYVVRAEIISFSGSLCVFSAYIRMIRTLLCSDKNSSDINSRTCITVSSSNRNKRFSNSDSCEPPCCSAISSLASLVVHLCTCSCPVVTAKYRKRNHLTLHSIYWLIHLDSMVLK